MLETIRDLGKAVTDENVKVLLVCFEDKVQGKMSQQELYEMCLNWSYHYALGDLCSKAYPPVPERVKDYNKLAEFKRKKLLESSDKVREAVVDYRRKYLAVKYHNRSNKDWLEQMFNLFKKKSEQEKVQRVEELLEGYE